jgi:small subunit ribosomal protein S1
MFKEGVTIQAKVIHVSAEERRLGLSIKQIKDDEERRRPKEFRSGPAEAGGQTLGDILKLKLEEDAADN